MDHCIKITWGVVTKADSWAISPVYWIRFLIREIPWNCSHTHHPQVTVMNNKALLLFSHAIVSDSLRLHGLQHARLPCPSLSPRICSNSCPFSQWCHPTISSSVVPFSSCPQSFPASGSFPMSWFFTSGGQSNRASVSVLPMNIQDWSPLGLTALISLLSKGLSRVFSNTTVQKHQFFGTQASLWSSSHIHTLGNVKLMLLKLGWHSKV